MNQHFWNLSFWIYALKILILNFQILETWSQTSIFLELILYFLDLGLKNLNPKS